MSLESLKGYHLARGTAIALQLGHRTSTDLDFFGNSKVAFEVIKNEIRTDYSYRIVQESPNIIIGFIDGIKVDVVRYKYSHLSSPIVEGNITLHDLRDLCCMKLAAITGRGRKRDFIDIYFLFQLFSLREMISFYERKYDDASLQLLLKSMTYFEDAENDPLPKMLIEVEWSDIKSYILNQLHDFNSNFL